MAALPAKLGGVSPFLVDSIALGGLVASPLPAYRTGPALAFCGGERLESKLVGSKRVVEETGIRWTVVNSLVPLIENVYRVSSTAKELAEAGIEPSVGSVGDSYDKMKLRPESVRPDSR